MHLTPHTLVLAFELLMLNHKSPTNLFPSPITRQSRQIVLKLTAIYQLTHTFLQCTASITVLVHSKKYQRVTTRHW